MLQTGSSCTSLSFGRKECQSASPKLSSLSKLIYSSKSASSSGQSSPVSRTTSCEYFSDSSMRTIDSHQSLISVTSAEILLSSTALQKQCTSESSCITVSDQQTSAMSTGKLVTCCSLAHKIGSKVKFVYCPKPERPSDKLKNGATRPTARSPFVDTFPKNIPLDDEDEEEDDLDFDDEDDHYDEDCDSDDEDLQLNELAL